MCVRCCICLSICVCMLFNKWFSGLIYVGCLWIQFDVRSRRSTVDESSRALCPTQTSCTLLFGHWTRYECVTLCVFIFILFSLDKWFNGFLNVCRYKVQVEFDLSIRINSVVSTLIAVRHHIAAAVLARASAQTISSIVRPSPTCLVNNSCCACGLDLIWIESVV